LIVNKYLLYIVKLAFGSGASRKALSPVGISDHVVQDFHINCYSK
jgi:hypothetical protein